jgi:hypothetical protein
MQFRDRWGHSRSPKGPLRDCLAPPGEQSFGYGYYPRSVASAAPAGQSTANSKPAQCFHYLVGYLIGNGRRCHPKASTHPPRPVQRSWYTPGTANDAAALFGTAVDKPLNARVAGSTPGGRNALAWQAGQASRPRCGEGSIVLFMSSSRKTACLSD